MPDHDTAPTSAALLVIYTQQLGACRAFYAGLGLRLVEEQHGSGPIHYAAELPGLVLELYPAASADRATGRLRLGLTVAPEILDRLGVTGGRGVIHDPDGRAVDVSALVPAAV